MTDASLMELIKNLTQFGVAGLMGVLWVIERWLSRRRETQLDEAHHLLHDQEWQSELELRRQEAGTACMLLSLKVQRHPSSTT